MPSTSSPSPTQSAVHPSPHAPPGHRSGERAASVLPPLKDDEAGRPAPEPVPKQHPDTR